MPMHSVLTEDRREYHLRHLIPFHNLGDISQNIGISKEVPQLLTAAKEKKKSLKLVICIYPVLRLGNKIR